MENLQGQHVDLVNTDDRAQFLVRAGVPDLAVTKTDSSDPAYVGKDLTYTITITNNGSSSATFVTMDDPLPAGVTYVSVSSTKGTCSYDGTYVYCDIDTMAAAEQVTVTITVRPTTVGTITNTATVLCSEIVAPVTATQDTIVRDSPALVVTKTDLPDPVHVGELLTYTIAITNNGSQPATVVNMTDTLPADVTYVSASSTKGTCNHSGNQVTCAIGAMAVDQQVTVTIIVTPTTVGTITNTATVSCNETASVTATQDTNVLAASADLAVTKIDSPDPVYAGENLTYTIDITNSGPSTASNVTMIDVLPAGVTYVSASSTKGTCSHSGGQVICIIDTMDVSESATVTIIVTPTTPGSISNSVMVYGSENDPDISNNTAAQDTTVQASADLAVTKTGSADPVYVGNNLTYTVAVSNIGPSPATGVTMTDTLPAGVTYVSASSTKGTCSHSGDQVTCTIGPMAVNESATVTIIVTPTTPGIITNTAIVSGIEHDPNSLNNTATLETTVLASADLAVTKTDSPDPLYVGNNLTYTVAVSNIGPSPATGVTMTDTLPAGVTYVSASSTKGTCSHSGDQVTCTIGPMAVSEPVTVTIIVTLTTPGIITNTAMVSGIEHDPNPLNNIATLETTVLASADLAVTKTDSPDPVYVGENLTYTVAVTNNGPSSATGVTMTDTLPTGVTYVSASSTKGTCSHSGDQITCAIGPMAVSESATITIVVTPTTPGTITNTAIVSGNEHDPILSNNTVAQETTVLASADLVVTKTDSPDPVYVGENLTYTVDVTNNGPSSATGVTMTDTLPAGVTFVSASSTKGTCGQFGNQVSCSIGPMAVSELVTVTIIVTPTTPGTITNTAIVSGIEHDPNLSNNTATHTTTVLASADLAVTKTDLPDPVYMGNNLTYTVAVTNNGPSTASGVTMTDALPAGVTYVSASSTKGTCFHSANQVICIIDTMDVSDSATVTIIVTPTTPGTITNMASVSGIEHDPNLSNNTVAQTTTVLASADLAVTKTDSPDPVYVGENLTYTVAVTNIGPSSATGVIMTDTLPAGVTYVSASSTKGTCSYSGTQVICAIDPMAVSESATVTIVVTPTTPGTISNTALVGGNEYDPNLSNNTATQNTTVRASADLAVTKTASPAPVYVGENLTYTIVVTNNGPSAASGVSLFDILPANVTFVSASSTKGTCNHSGTQVTCAIGPMAVSELVTATIIVTPTTPGTISNTAYVSGIEHDPNLINNTTTQTTTVLASADLAVTKTDSPDPVYVGENLTYTIDVTNNGTSPATGVTMTDTLPTGVTYVSASSTKGTCSFSGTQVICTIGPMAVSELETVTIIVTPTTPGTITNTANAFGNEHDPILSNNTATQSTTVLASADLAVTKTDSPDPLYVGENLTYTIEVSNNGPSTASGVTMTDTLPAGVTYVSSSSTKGACSHSGTEVICAIGSMAVSELVTVTIIVTPTTSTVITNTASVSGIEYDPNPFNNTAIQDTDVLASADLAVAKNDSPDPVYVGENLTYTVDVYNDGPSPAIGVIMTDTLPAGVTYVSASSTKGTCSHSGDQVTCAIGPMAVNELVTITIIVTPTTPGTISNTADVYGIEHDPNLNNNTVAQETTVLASADLAVTKTDSPDPVYVGENLTYTIDVTNNGPSAASGVTMIDTLPAGVTYVSASSTKGTCSHSGDQVICIIDTMDVVDEVIVTIIVTPTTPGTITNTAVVSGIEHDPNLTNNTATQDTTVLASADLAVTKTDSPDPIHVEENLIYTIEVTNNGPSTASEVFMIDTLPADVTYVSASSTKGTCSYDGTEVVCAIGTMSVSELVTVTIIVTTTIPETITNTAVVQGFEYDPNLTNNTATQDTTVLPGEKLTLTSGIIQNMGMLHDGPYATDTTLFLLNTDPNNSYTVTIDLYDRSWWGTPHPTITNTLTVAPNNFEMLLLRLDFLPVYEIRVSYYHEVQSTCNDESHDLLVVTSFGINNVNYSNILGQTLLQDNFKKLKLPAPIIE